MLSRRHLTGLLVFGLLLAAFVLAPTLLSLDEIGNGLRAALYQIGGPLAALVACLAAARRTANNDHRAWRNFAIGSALYLAGNLFYLYFGIVGITPQFPTLPEAAYFVMALFFCVGMFQYGNIRTRVGRVQVYNFILIYCAVTLGSLFALTDSLASTVLGPLGTVTAFLYPALWFSVAASGLISLLLYEHREKTVAIALMLLAILAESIADYLYAIELMQGTWKLGGASQVLWVASAGLIVWAALEQLALARRGIKSTHGLRRENDKGMWQAAIPGLAIAMVLLAGSATGALGSGNLAWLSGSIAVVFAATLALREHWMIDIQRNLRSAVERSRQALKRGEAQLSAVLESTSDSVLVLDRDWKIVYFNGHAAEIIGQPGRLYIGVSIWDLFPAAATSGEGDHYRRAMTTGVAEAFEIFVEDRQAWLGIQAFPGVDGLSIFFRDISESRRIREELSHLAHHDALTGLANRTLFQDRLQQALANDCNVATLLLDLDHFKEVNDTLGHSVGDAVLVATAERLRACLRSSDTIARLGGDEFAAILVGYHSIAELRPITHRILEATKAPVGIDGQTVLIGSSAGAALASEDNRDPERLLKEADIALYAAKTDARGTCRFFEEQMEAGLIERQALRADLRVALERGQFELAFQPLLDLKSNRITCFETLLRWRHPTLGMVRPDLFIPIAEETGLILPIGTWVLREACLAAVHWPGDVSVAVNLSTRQFRDTTLAEIIQATLVETSLPAARLELEITESVLLKESRANLITLRQLRAMGVRIVLDDFGTGYSSLGYLQRFAFSKIKIDRSFISGLPASDESQAIVRAITGLGKSLGIRVTAEGVETEAQLEWVRRDCDEAQGYLLGRPAPLGDVPRILGNWNNGTHTDARRAG